MTPTICNTVWLKSVTTLSRCSRRSSSVPTTFASSGVTPSSVAVTRWELGDKLGRNPAELASEFVERAGGRGEIGQRLVEHGQHPLDARHRGVDAACGLLDRAGCEANRRV